MPPVSRKVLFAATLALTLAGCWPDRPKTAAAPPSQQLALGNAFVLTTTGKLASFDLATPATVRSTVTVTGLQSDEQLLGIDFRPADGQLYGLGSSGRIYVLDGATGAATLKSVLAADAGDTSAPYVALSGTQFGIDFNPVADRLRIVSNTGQNLRVNVDTGATITDGAITGGTAAAAAYTNSFSGTASTTLFVIDPATSTLYRQNPPDNGTLGSPVTLGVSASAVAGFDIDARTNTGYAIVTVGSVRTLYALNLSATAAPAMPLGLVGVPDEVRDLAIRTPAAPLAYGLTDDARLLTFKTATPNSLDASVALTGLANGERLIGIDVRPKDALLYGVTSNARVVTINPATGVVTVKATLAADPADTTAPFGSLAGSSFAVDFNPAADRLRVISNTGQNLRINVDTGATITDSPINRNGVVPAVTAAAYSNSYAGAAATTLYDIDVASATLATQNPPNDGPLVNVGALGVTVAGDIGFDIAGGANGLAIAALRSTATGASSLYRVALATGSAVLLNGTSSPAKSTVGAGNVGLVDIALILK